MKKIDFEHQGQTVTIEIDPSGVEGDWEATSRVGSAKKTLNDLLAPVSAFSSSIVSVVQKMDVTPSEFEITAGVTVTADANIIFSKVATEGQFQVRFMWKSNEDAPTGA